MKISTLIIVCASSISSYATEFAEANKIHPDKHTIQILWADLSDDFDVNSPFKQIPENWSQLSQEERMKVHAEQKKIGLEHIKKTDSKIIILATIYTESGVEFVCDKGVIKGTLNIELGTIDFQYMKIPNWGTLQPTTVKIESNNWFSMYIGGQKTEHCLLIKYYPPMK